METVIMIWRCFYEIPSLQGNHHKSKIYMVLSGIWFMWMDVKLICSFVKYPQDLKLEQYS